MRKSIWLFSVFFKDSKIIQQWRPKRNSLNPGKCVYIKSTENNIVTSKIQRVLLLKTKAHKGCLPRL